MTFRILGTRLECCSGDGGARPVAATDGCYPGCISAESCLPCSLSIPSSAATTASCHSGSFKSQSGRPAHFEFGWACTAVTLRSSPTDDSTADAAVISRCADWQSRGPCKSAQQCNSSPKCGASGPKPSIFPTPSRAAIWLADATECSCRS
jgi:hypothetical protein